MIIRLYDYSQMNENDLPKITTHLANEEGLTRVSELTGRKYGEIRENLAQAASNGATELCYLINTPRWITKEEFSEQAQKRRANGQTPST